MGIGHSGVVQIPGIWKTWTKSVVAAHTFLGGCIFLGLGLVLGVGLGLLFFGSLTCRVRFRFWLQWAHYLNLI